MLNKEIPGGIMERDIDRAIGSASIELEISSRLQSLRELDLGRAFIYREKDAEVLLAYSIPVNREQTKHVVLFNDGLAYVTEPNGENNKLGYSHEMGPSPVPYSFNTSDIQAVQRLFMFGSDTKSRIVMKSSNLENIPEIQKLIEESLRTSQDLKRERDQALQNSPQMVVETVGFFLNNLNNFQSRVEESELDEAGA